jgi:hypothetical protein
VEAKKERDVPQNHIAEAESKEIFAAGWTNALLEKTRRQRHWRL